MRHDQLIAPNSWDFVDVYCDPTLEGHPDFHDGWSPIRPRQVELNAHKPSGKSGREATFEPDPHPGSF